MQYEVVQHYVVRLRLIATLHTCRIAIPSATLDPHQIINYVNHIKHTNYYYSNDTGEVSFNAKYKYSTNLR